MSGVAKIREYTPINTSLYNFANLAGRRFGRLTVTKLLGKYKNGTFWLCVCDCGNERAVLGPNLTKGASGSCGCLRLELTEKLRKTHGMSDTPIHNRWMGMLKRCENPKCKSYDDYGGRGIEVCERWHSFENFYADMGDPPTPKHQIDRKNNDGNYEPGNCRWATQKEQANNKRKRRYIKKPVHATLA